MKSIFTEKLLFLNAGVLTLSFTNIEMVLKLVLLLVSIILSVIRIYKYLKVDTNADTDTKLK